MNKALKGRGLPKHLILLALKREIRKTTRSDFENLCRFTRNYAKTLDKLTFFVYMPNRGNRCSFSERFLHMNNAFLKKKPEKVDASVWGIVVEAWELHADLCPHTR